MPSPDESTEEAEDAHGLQWKTIKPGNATHYPKEGSTVSIHYVGKLSDGSTFDSSRDRQRPFEFKVGAGQVIQAWEEVIPQMSIGQIVVITATPAFAYGVYGFPPLIPGAATLIYECELLNFCN